MKKNSSIKFKSDQSSIDGYSLLQKVNEELIQSIVPKYSALDPLKDFPIFINQFAYSINHSSLKVTSHRGFNTLLGYEDKDFSVQFILNLFHPADGSRAMELTSHVLRWAGLFPAEPFSSVFSLNYRVRKASGEYIKILRQTTANEIDKAGKLLSSISICTDITHLQVSDVVSAKFIGANAEVDLEETAKGTPTKSAVNLSKREMDILALAAEGKTSAEIADILYISLNTVNTHRRNMLARNNFNNIAQLITHIAGKRII